MTTLVSASALRPALPVHRQRVSARVLAPTIAAVINAAAFFVIQPGVNDLWAARARASAASHGVGLTYWFSWFGGGSTPGNYSILTPYVCAWFGTELVGAVSAVAITVLGTVLVRDTRHPQAAAAVIAVTTAVNLWSGRVPFLLGAVFAVAALIAVRHQRRAATVSLTLLSVLASPVAGAFIALGLSGTFLSTRTRSYRPIIGYAVITAGVVMGAAGLAFGAPGPQTFSLLLLAELLAGLLLLRVGRPPDHLRTTLWVTMLACVVLYAVPNGLGSNVARLVWFGLPAAVVALGAARLRILGLAVVPLIAVGSHQTLTDLRTADRPVSSVGYYSSLAHRLDALPNLENYRVEMVDHGAHAGYDALLGHASLARGWETQEDAALNAVLNQGPLSPVAYKIWLDNNAVGYVAMPATTVGENPEYSLVSRRTPAYLVPIWRSADWSLYRVVAPTPIVGAPAHIVGHTQSSMTVDVPCACTVSVRVRWSNFLGVHKQPPPAPALAPAAPPPTTPAPTVAPPAVAGDGSGWTTITTSRPGTYVLSGSIRGLLR